MENNYSYIISQIGLLLGFIVVLIAYHNERKAHEQTMVMLINLLKDLDYAITKRLAQPENQDEPSFQSPLSMGNMQKRTDSVSEENSEHLGKKIPTVSDSRDSLERKTQV